jgi:hypothetical protein
MLGPWALGFVGLIVYTTMFILLWFAVILLIGVLAKRQPIFEFLLFLDSNSACGGRLFLTKTMYILLINSQRKLLRQIKIYLL